MKTCSPALINFLGSNNEAVVAELITISPTDGSGPYMWTSYDQDVLGFSCRGPIIEYNGGSLRHAVGSENSNVDLMLSVGDSFVLPNGKSLQLSVHDGEFDDAYVTIDRLYMPTPGDISLGTMRWFAGYVGPSKPCSSGVILTIESLISRLNISMPRRMFQASCPFAVYDDRCRLPRTYAPDAVANSNYNSITIGSTNGGTNWVLGTITFTSGILQGVVRQVMTQNGGVLNFTLPLPTLPAVGDTVNLLLGCDKSLATCTALGNKPHFGGFPYVPIPESAL